MLAAVTEPAPASRRRRRLKLALGLIVLAPAGFVAFSLFYLRHRTWEIPAEWRAPALAKAEPVPAAGNDHDDGLWLTWLGVTGYRLNDGVTTLLVDPTPTRPSGLGLLLPCESDPELAKEWCPKADVILVNHAHHDHALDVPTIARQTGAQVYGSQSSVNLCLSRGVPAAQTHVIKGGDTLTLGTFQVEVVACYHSAIAGIQNPMAGVIPPDAGSLRWWQFGQDGCFAFRIKGGDVTLWDHPTSTYLPGSLGARTAPNLIVGITGEPLTEERAKGIVSECKPRRVLPTHYDNFLQPIGKGLSLLPGLDIEEARRHVEAADPKAAWWVLDFNQTVFLPPDED